MSEQPFPGESADRSGDAAATSPVDPATGVSGGAGSGAATASPGAAGAAPPATDTAAWRALTGALELVPCQFPGGCANSMEYAGSGRRPKYCYQVVGGVMHDRVNAKRIADGGVPARRRGEIDDALARPIARAGQSVTDQVAVLIARLDHSSSELRDALDTLADPEAVAAEIAAAQRVARAEVDAAQAVADEARAQARAARAAAEAARRSAAASDDEAATAVAERDAAEYARAEAVTAREAAEAQLAEARAELEQQIADLTAERDTARAETERVTTELTAQLAGVRAELQTAIAERDTAAAERDTTAADLAATRRDLDRAETDRARLADEINDLREQAAEYRAARAAAESSLAALREQLVHDVDRERAYGEQRLADVETRYTAQIADLRTELARAQGRAQRRSTGRASEQDLAPPNSDSDSPAELGEGQAAGPERPAGVRRARPRAAQRRPGPTQPPSSSGDSSDAPGDLP